MMTYMANLVLYRKYRPKSFKDIVGQEHIVRAITQAIAHNDFAHSYLFAGPRGTGKTTFARLIAKAINCENWKEGAYEPCGSCVSCDEIARGVAVDLIEIDAASNRGIDEVRSLKEGIRFAPTRSKYKVFIVDEVHMLTKEAFNALLKTLEEPPAHAVFILATTEVHKVLPTIISRSQHFDFRKLFHKEIRGRLLKLVKLEGKKVDEKILDLIASRSGGSLRDAENMLGQILIFGPSIGSGQGQDGGIDDAAFLFGCAGSPAIFRFLNALAGAEKKEAILCIRELTDKGVDLEEFIKEALQYLRWIMFLKIDTGLGEIIEREISQDECTQLTQVAANFSMQKVNLAAHLFLTASQDMKYSPIPELPLEMAVVELLES